MAPARGPVYALTLVGVVLAVTQLRGRPAVLPASTTRAAVAAAGARDAADAAFAASLVPFTSAVLDTLTAIQRTGMPGRYDPPPDGLRSVLVRKGCAVYRRWREGQQVTADEVAGQAASLLAAVDARPCAPLPPDGNHFWALGLDAFTDKVTHPAAAAGSLDAANRHRYQEAYQQVLGPLRCAPLRFLEIGLGCTAKYGAGHSVPLWLRWLPRARLVEMEYDRACGERFQREDPLALGAHWQRVKLVFGDQAQPAVLLAAEAGAGPWDVVVDDGGHSMVQQTVTLRTLLPRVRPGGLFIVEDLLTSQPPLSRSPRYADAPVTTWAYLLELVRLMQRVAAPAALPADVSAASLAPGTATNATAFPDAAALAPLVKSMECFQHLCVLTRWTEAEADDAALTTADAPPPPRVQPRAPLS